MSRQVRLNPVLGIGGLAALMAAVLAASQGDRKPGRAIAARNVEVRERVLEGSKAELGDGEIRSWVKVDDAGYPLALGVTFTEAALQNLPKGQGGHAAKTCCDGPAYVLAIPEGVLAFPFKHVWVNWNPNGHEPEGVYDVPHFDFHFYMQTVEEREAITAEGEDLARCAKPLPIEGTPAGYVMAPGGVAKMGGHWLPASAPELRGEPFVKTFLYGSYNGRMSFLEPMITKAYLDSKKDYEEVLAAPGKYPSAGFWPTKYVIRFDEQKREYTVALEGLVWRE